MFDKLQSRWTAQSLSAAKDSDQGTETGHHCRSLLNSAMATMGEMMLDTRALWFGLAGWALHDEGAG